MDEHDRTCELEHVMN